MKIEQLVFNKEQNNSGTNIKVQNKPTLFLIFGSPSFFKKNHLINSIKNRFPEVQMLGCSTAGEIHENQVTDDTLVVTAIELEKTNLECHSIEVTHIEDSYKKGKELGKAFKYEGLKHIFLLSAGLSINGDDLVNGLLDTIPNDVKLTGGIAGDADNFEETFILNHDNLPNNSSVKAIGFYGDAIQIGYSSIGGWKETETRLRVTKSENNILYRLNNRPALDVYKEYLGEMANQLPAIGLKYPFNMKIEGFDEPVVRTILGMNEEDKSLTFAGNIVKGSTLKIMKASVDRIIDGAKECADICLKEMKDPKDVELTILISCVGRKLFLKDFVSEEVEKIRDEIGENSVYSGFYSYGEIAPFKKGSEFRLHNQTMTLTTLSETLENSKPNPNNKEAKGIFSRLFNK